MAVQENRRAGRRRVIRQIGDVRREGRALEEFDKARVIASDGAGGVAYTQIQQCSTMTVTMFPPGAGGEVPARQEACIDVDRPTHSLPGQHQQRHVAAGVIGVGIGLDLANRFVVAPIGGSNDVEKAAAREAGPPVQPPACRRGECDLQDSFLGEHRPPRVALNGKIAIGDDFAWPARAPILTQPVHPRSTNGDLTAPKGT